MDTTTVSMSQLFAQLGLPDDQESIGACIEAIRPLPMTVRLYDAPFGSPAQLQLQLQLQQLQLQQLLQDDGEWAVLAATLNAQLRGHPVAARRPRGSA